MKKWIALVCIIGLILTMLPMNVTQVAAASDSGVCGENLTYTIKYNTITISGTGDMYNYSKENPAPWNQVYLNMVKLESGVSSIGSYAFAACRMGIIIIPASVKSIGSMAFADNGRNTRTYFLGEAPEIAEDIYVGTRSVNYTVMQWKESEKQQYGGTVQWNDATVAIESTTENLISPGHVFGADDFSYSLITYASYPEKIDFQPQQVIFGEYDNTSCGAKTITITVDGHIFDIPYVVTDGTNHLDLIHVVFPELAEYKHRTSDFEPTVMMGGVVLKKSTHYDLKYDGTTTDEMMHLTIQGKGICKGFQKTFYYPVVMRDISKGYISVNHLDYFTGIPITGGGVMYDGYSLEEGVDYDIFYENNINMGTATVRAVGKGMYYGELSRNFEITVSTETHMLKGNYLGQAGSELSTDIAISQKLITPCEMFWGKVNTSKMHIASYDLYRLDGEDEVEYTLITSEETPASTSNIATRFEYDFSFVYEEAADVGGHIYMLAYSWVTVDMEVYGGAMFLYVPSKVADATSMTMFKIQDDGDFRKEHLWVYGDDGALGEVQWTSSDSSVATVEKGTVTLHKPGIVTISAQYGEMIETKTINAPALDFTQGIIFDYSEETGTARVIYDNRLLTEGTDYVLSVDKNGDAVTVTAIGCGLFTGELVKVFENLDSLADPHTHGFTNSCDNTCNSCEFTRDNDHRFSEAWSKDQTHHWHVCTACGEKEGIAAHILSPDNNRECTVCGVLWIPGDIDGNMAVNRDDVVQLLLYVSMPVAFPIAAPADFTDDGTVNRDDVVQLLLHVSMPDAFPLA